MADLFKKKNAEAEAVEASAEEKKEKKEKKQKNKIQYLEHNNMNFLERYETVVEGKTADKGLDAYKKPIMLLLVVLVVLGVVAQGLNIYSGMRIKSLEKYINDEANVKSYNQAVEVKTAVEQAKLQKTNMESLIAAIATYPDVDQAFFNAVNGAAAGNSVIVNSYGYTGSVGSLTVACTGTTPQNVSDFVRALDATGLFAEVEYLGFTGGAEGGYNFSVTCYCNAGK